MKKEDSIKRVNLLLSRWVAQIQLNNALSFYDINNFSEGLSAKLLNIIYGYNLVNLNNEQRNHPFDLGDKEAGIAFQVTSRTDTGKVIGSLENFIDRSLDIEYPRGLYFLILSINKIPRLNPKITEKISGFYQFFDPREHIISLKKLAQDIQKLYDTNITRFTQVLSLLEDEFSDQQKQVHIASTPNGITEPDYTAPSSAERKSYPSITLKRLILDNIKCFSRVQLDFPAEDEAPSWTVLVGDNGVGKTTILHAAALCAMGPELASKTIPFPDNMVRIGAEKGYMEALFEITMDEAPPTELRIRLDITKGSKSFNINIDEGTGEAELVNRFITARDRTDFDGWFVAGYGAVRNLLFTDEPSKTTRRDFVIDRVSSLFDPTKILIDPASLYRFLSGDTSPFKELGAPSRLSPETTGNIRTLLDKLLPMIHFLETNGTEKLATDFGSVPISELSEGYKSMLSWLAHLIVHLLRAVHWSGKIDIVKGIVLIDEVDLHLHPGWQQEVIPLLRECFPHLQFIGCTHSPMTVGGADEGHIVLLERDGKDIHVKQDLPSIRGWRADQVLTSPIFGLKTSRDKKTQDMLEEYKQLISVVKPSPEQEKRLQYLRKTISGTLPSSGETEIQREAFKIIEETMKSYFDKQPPGRKQKLLEEIKRQLQR